MAAVLLAAPAGANEPGEVARDPGDTWGIFLPTAYTRTEGQGSCGTVWGVLWNCEYGASRYFDMGFVTGLPVPIGVVGAHAKAGIRFPGGAASAQAMVLTFLPVWEEGFAEHLSIVAAGPVLTLGQPDLFVNIGLPLAHLSFEDESVRAALPYVGLSGRATRWLRLSVEIASPHDPEEGVPFGELQVLLYALRFVGQSAWADLAFITLIEEAGPDVIPFPFLSGGFTW